MPKKDADYIINYAFANRTMIYGIEMGACIPNLGEIKKEFSKLDKTNPYDNGLALTDVTRIDIIDKTDSSLKLALISRSYGNDDE